MLNNLVAPLGAKLQSPDNRVGCLSLRQGPLYPLTNIIPWHMVLQALTLFDEARCRGADLKLRPDAVGLLTLGPATCKDKLMQAAGGLWEAKSLLVM